MPTKRVEVIHTKELINHAFKELLLEKEFDRITVMDISSKAQINRATFYLHFKDKQELYTNYMEYFFYHVDIILHNIMSPTYVNKGLDQFVTKPFPPIAALFSYMKKEEALTNCLLGLKSSRETTLLDLRQVFGHTLPKCFLGATSRMDCSTSQVARQSEKSL